MPEMTRDEVGLFAADLERADSLSHASLVFRYARAMAAGRALWGSRRDWQESTRAKRAEHVETLHMLEHAYAVIERDAAAAKRALDDMHADLTAARERVAEVEAQRDSIRDQFGLLFDFFAARGASFTTEQGRVVAVTMPDGGAQ